MFPTHIFKAYDIRGVYPTELNEDLAYRVGRSFTFLRQKELGRSNVKLVAGHDMRLSSPSLFLALKNGIIDQGGDVVDVGLCSTPTFYFATAYFQYDGGVLVTASHNPKEYNGIKLVREAAKPVGKGIGMEELRALVEEDNLPVVEQKGVVTPHEQVGLEEVETAKKWGELEKIKPFKIVLDTANSMGITYLEPLFAALPQVELIKMNSELDGSFPSHQPDPFQEENTRELRARVVAEGADLGIATDGDGDRIFFVDDEGVLVEPALVRGIMAKIFLRSNPGAVICYDIRPGKITEDMILENGGKPSVTKVGHSLIKEQMLKTGAVFGGESSGHFFVRFPFGTFEAPLVVVVKFLQELSESGMSLSEYIKPLQRYFHSGEINYQIQDKDQVFARLKDKYSDAQISDLDGLTFTYSDWWFNVRGSNTEPLLRLNLEAKTKEIMQQKVQEVGGVIGVV